MKTKLYRCFQGDEGFPVMVADGAPYSFDGGKRMDNPDSAVQVFKELKLHLMAEEYLYGVALDRHCRLIGAFEVSHGSVAATMIPVRETLQKVLLLGGSALILAHNHPSGIIDPSEFDVKGTKVILDGCNTVGISFLDHIILGGNREETYCSLKEMMPDLFNAKKR